jgi:hypothetical protein
MKIPLSHNREGLITEYHSIVRAFYNLYTFASDFVVFIEKKVRPTVRNVFGFRTSRYKFKDFTSRYLDGIKNTIETIENDFLALESLDESEVDDIMLRSYRKNYLFYERTIMEKYNLIINRCKKLEEPKCIRDFNDFRKEHEQLLVKL